jgi:L-amino acid N-acyltransferase YncA
MDATRVTTNSKDCVVRQAIEADLPAILTIYNEAVLNQTSIWERYTGRAGWPARLVAGARGTLLPGAGSGCR